MIVNFINPSHYNNKERNENNPLKSVYDRYEYSSTRVENSLENSIEKQYSSNIYTICIISSLVFILYFILIVPMFFMDIFIGLMYELDEFTCKEVQNPIVKIDKWLFLNGIIGYLGLIILICLKRIYIDEGFGRRILKIFGYVINVFLFIWTGLGLTLFFKDYYEKTDCFNSYIYNYILIRMILAPIVGFFKFMEIYCS